MKFIDACIRLIPGPIATSSGSTAGSFSASPHSVALRSRCHAFRYSSYFPSRSDVHRETDATPRITFAGMMCHASSGMTYAARKSKAPVRYLALLLFTEQIYPSPLCTRCHCAFHLHRDKLPRTPHHAIKAIRVAKRFAHRQPVLRRPRHKHRLRPLPPLLAVLDHLRSPLFHSALNSNSSPREPHNAGRRKKIGGNPIADAALSLLFDLFCEAEGKQIPPQMRQHSRNGTREHIETAAIPCVGAASRIPGSAASRPAFQHHNDNHP